MNKTGLEPQELTLQCRNLLLTSKSGVKKKTVHALKGGNIYNRHQMCIWFPLG